MENDPYEFNWTATADSATLILRIGMIEKPTIT